MNDLCRATQPDKPCARCIRYTGHTGPHQTFVAEWHEGAEKARRRNAPVFAKRRQPHSEALSKVFAHRLKQPY
jgi:hypothetical protein